MDGSISVTFPTADYDLAQRQSLSAPSEYVIGQHGSVDLLGGAPALIDDGEDTLRFTVRGATPADVDTAIDALRLKLYQIGEGKLFTIDSNGVRRWSLARAEALPEISWRAGDIFRKAASLMFRRKPFEYLATAIDVSEEITLDGATFVVNNPGTLPATRVTITVSGSGWDNFTVRNTTPVDGIEYEFTVNRASASADDVSRLDTRVPSVEYSDDDGDTWADDFVSYEFPADNAQEPLTFALAPGDNTIEFESDGTVNCIVRIEADAPVL